MKLIKSIICAALFVNAISTVFAGDKYIGSCALEEMKLDIYYTSRVRNDYHVVKVIQTSEEGTSKRDWAAMGWEDVDGIKVFVIADKFGIGLVQGETSDNIVFAMGVPAEKISCKINLTPVEGDFPLVKE